jgi:hypothetical protein
VRAGALILGDDGVEGHDERYALTRVRTALDLLARAVLREVAAEPARGGAWRHATAHGGARRRAAARS